jgi:hypothetical protein
VRGDVKNGGWLVTEVWLAVLRVSPRIAVSIGGTVPPKDAAGVVVASVYAGIKAMASAPMYSTLPDGAILIVVPETVIVD